MKKPLIILTGPTAVGKTALSIKLARAIDGEIISADSVQVYRRMDIGSAKITKQEMEGIPHYLIDVLEPEEDFNVMVFQQMAKKAMDEIYARGKIPIITGGTGFYIQAVLNDISFTETDADDELRKKLEEEAEQNGADALHQKLQAVDPKAAEEIHPNNVKRVIRALEFYLETGKKISEHNAAERQKESPYNFAYFVLNMDRQKLYSRIELRVDQMLEAGLVEEVRQLKQEGCQKGMVSMQALGYKEILSWLNGECTFDEAISILKRDTRRFAKRQLTWFRREKDVCWIEKEQYDNDEDRILNAMIRILYEKGILTDQSISF
ncbi:MAG: tRNA (adenosine(37)-N6)-dimethylallyltransferase MiaA [Lachnospiraceae bacterium]|nr:tRNA (adenosine(37)-N6)-dimethylallyltransferase MiaA [Lachnospiraceae bacterium]